MDGGLSFKLSVSRRASEVGLTRASESVTMGISTQESPNRLHLPVVLLFLTVAFQCLGARARVRWACELYRMVYP